MPIPDTDLPTGPFQALSACLSQIEARLSDMDEAFQSGDVTVLETRSRAVQDSLADALHAFSQTARDQPDGLASLPASLRQRLRAAQARLVSQQVAVHRALHTYGRTLGALFPQAEAPTYGAMGNGPAAKALKAYR